MPDCIFCRIAAGEIPAAKVHDSEHLIAFRDVNPQAPVHILIIPKRHVESVLALQEADSPLVGEIHLLAARLARDEGIADSGFRLVTNTNAAAGQSVPHLHFHLLGGRRMRWPPG